MVPNRRSLPPPTASDTQPPMAALRCAMRLARLAGSGQ